MEYHNNCEIPLKLFYQIIETGDLRLLLFKYDNNKVNQDELSDAWDKIIEEYSQYDNNMVIKQISEYNQELWRLACEQAEVKGMLLYLIGGYKKEYIERLQELGYPIDVSNFEAKKKSLVKCDKRANHIKTRMQLVHKKIEKLGQDNGKSNFDSTMSWLAVNLKFEPREDITVRRYLEYKKQISERIRLANSKKKRPAEVAE